MISAPSALVVPVAGLLLAAAAAAQPVRSASSSSPSPTDSRALSPVEASSMPPPVAARAGPRPVASPHGVASSHGVTSSHGVAPSTASAQASVPIGRWAWPLVPRPAVARAFVRASSQYGPGHRGVDLLAAPGQQVGVVDAGTVTHVGVIAGRGTVSVLHGSGLRSTYEPVTAEVRIGAVLGRGGLLGTVSGVAGHCAPSTCLHLGALRGRTYVDPLQLLGPRRIRLLPLQ